MGGGKSGKLSLTRRSSASRSPIDQLPVAGCRLPVSHLMRNELA